MASTEVVPFDVELGLGTVTEQFTVRGDARSFLGTVQTGTNVQQSLMATLPSSRTITAVLGMAPNVKPTGPGRHAAVVDGSFTIAGAMSYDSVFLLNGVAITENIRGQPFSLFIEDAIQETTVSTVGHLRGVRTLRWRSRECHHQVGRQPVQRLVSHLA